MPDARGLIIIALENHPPFITIFMDGIPTIKNWWLILAIPRPFHLSSIVPLAGPPRLHLGRRRGARRRVVRCRWRWLHGDAAAARQGLPAAVAVGLGGMMAGWKTIENLWKMVIFHGI